MKMHGQMRLGAKLSKSSMLRKTYHLILRSLLIPKSAISFARRHVRRFLSDRFEYSHRTLDQLIEEKHSRDWLYNYFEYQFYFEVPKYVRKHRKYYAKKSRGFGEAAFHALWYQIVTERHPHRMLEIGVYRGQILSLWNLIAKQEGIFIDVWGLSPMAETGDQVSNYVKIDYEMDIEAHFAFWKLENFQIRKALSTSNEGMEFISDRQWDLIYIDGGHDLETVSMDWNISTKSLTKNGIVALDDSSLFTDLSLNHRGFRGHPGPSSVLSKLQQDQEYVIFGVGHINLVLKKK